MSLTEAYGAPDAPAFGVWVSVKDRLPETAGIKVLVTAKSSDILLPFRTKAVFTAFLGYGDGKWYTQDVDYMKNSILHDNEIHPIWEITHWMLPPEPHNYDEPDE